MGFLTLSPAQVTSITPASKDARVIAFQVPRTQTVAEVEAWLPADASIISIVRELGTASNAGTTGTVTLTVTNNSGTVSTATDDVKTNGATTGFVQMTALPNVQPVPLTGDLKITAVYAESGTASNTGGPWNYVVTYVR